MINKIANLYDKKLSLIGLWHRHPGSFDQFSSTDDGTNSKYARMRKEGAISALVNIDPEFRLTMYHVNQPCRYSIIEYDVGNHLIPDEMLQYKSPERFEKLMTGIMNDEYKDFRPSVSLNGFLKVVLPYMKRIKINESLHEVGDSNLATERILDELVEDTAFLADEQGIEYSISQVEQFICLSQDAIDVPVKLYFRYIAERMLLFSLTEVIVTCIRAMSSDELLSKRSKLKKKTLVKEYSMTEVHHYLTQSKR